MEVPVAQHVRGARCERRHQSIAEAQLAAEADGRGLLDQHRVGPAINHPAVEAICANDAAETIRGFEETNADTAALQLIRRSEPGDPGAYDDDVHAVHASMFSLLS